MKRWFGFAWVALIACSGAFAQVWFLINIGVISRVKRFDPYPFILLAMVVSVEGVAEYVRADEAESYAEAHRHPGSTGLADLTC